MRTEIPVLKRCCFCMPLRYGLLAWAYFKLIASSLLLIFFATTLYDMIHVCIAMHITTLLDHIIILTLLNVAVIADVALHIVFVISIHKKNAKLMRVYYIYAWTMLVVTVLLGTAFSIFLMTGVFRYYNAFLITMLVADLSTLFVNMLIQVYVIVLVRSEIIKLQNVGVFRFVNNAAEAECRLNVAEQDIEKGTENVFVQEEKVTEDNKNVNMCNKNGSICASKEGCCKNVV